MVVCYYISFCYMCILYIGYNFSLQVILLIGVHHLIELLVRTESLSRSRSWSECLRRRPRSSCFTRPWSSCSCSCSSSSSRGQPETIHSSNETSKENYGEGIRTLDPWHRMNLLLTNKPTRPRCPPHILKFKMYIMCGSLSQINHSKLSSLNLFWSLRSWDLLNVRTSATLKAHTRVH